MKFLPVLLSTSVFISCTFIASVSNHLVKPFAEVLTEVMKTAIDDVNAAMVEDISWAILQGTWLPGSFEYSAAMLIKKGFSDRMATALKDIIPSRISEVFEKLEEKLLELDKFAEVEFSTLKNEYRHQVFNAPPEEFSNSDGNDDL